MRRNRVLLAAGLVVLLATATPMLLGQGKFTSSGGGSGLSFLDTADPDPNGFVSSISGLVNVGGKQSLLRPATSDRQTLRWNASSAEWEIGESLDCTYQAVAVQAYTVGGGGVDPNLPCEQITDVGAKNLPRAFVFTMDMDHYTHGKLLYSYGRNATNSGDFHVKLHSLNDSDPNAVMSIISTQASAPTACEDKTPLLAVNLSALTGTQHFYVSYGDDPNGAVADPLLSTIGVMFCDGLF